jgi:hypothetical protein
LAGSPGENGGEKKKKKDLHSRTGRDETKRRTQERMERGSRKRSSSAGSEKMERVGEGQGKMERYCSTGQSPQRAVVPTEDEKSHKTARFSKKKKIIEHKMCVLIFSTTLSETFLIIRITKRDMIKNVYRC